MTLIAAVMIEKMKNGIILTPVNGLMEMAKAAIVLTRSKMIIVINNIGKR